MSEQPAEQTPEQTIADLTQQLAEAREEIRILTMARDKFKEGFETQSRLHMEVAAARKAAKLVGKAPKGHEEAPDA